MGTAYPVTFDVDRPEKLERPHVFLRILVAAIMSILAGAIGWIFGLVYLVLPVVAAVFVSQKGGEKYLEEDGGAEANARGQGGDGGEHGEGVEGGEVEEDVLGGPDGVVAELLDSGGVAPLLGVEVDAELEVRHGAPILPQREG